MAKIGEVILAGNDNIRKSTIKEIVDVYHAKTSYTEDNESEEMYELITCEPSDADTICIIGKTADYEEVAVLLDIDVENKDYIVDIL